MFEKKSISVSIQKNAGIWKVGDDEYRYDKLPVDVKIDLTLPTPSVNVKIYGISKEVIDEITTIQWQYVKPPQRRISITLWDEEEWNPVEIYTGQIMTAIPVFDKAPNVYLEITAAAGILFNFISLPPEITTQKGDIPAPDLVKRLCDYVGIGFENKGVNAVAKNPRFTADGLRGRIDEIARAYNFSFLIQNDRVTIFPKKETGKREVNFIFNSQNYIGYPSFTETGIKLKLDEVLNISYFDLFRIEGSEISAFNDLWRVNKVSYNLSTKIGGKWEMEIFGSRINDGN